MKPNPGLVLASQSPRRHELLTQIGVNFTVVDVDVPEIPAPGEAPETYVRRLAEDKARAGAALVSEVPVLGADTIVVHRGTILEKPRDEDEAAYMLGLLSGGWHQVCTAVSICYEARQVTRMSVTEVCFRDIKVEEIARYWQTGEPKGKAGGYAIQGFGAIFVENLRGSYSGVVGLPLAETQALLATFNVPWWQQS